MYVCISIIFSSLGWSISSFPASRPRSGFSFLCLSTYRCSKIVSNRCRNTGRIYPQMIWYLPQMIDFVEIPRMKQHPRPKFLWRDVIFKSLVDKSELNDAPQRMDTREQCLPQPGINRRLPGENGPNLDHPKMDDPLWNGCDAVSAICGNRACYLGQNNNDCSPD